MMLECEEYGTLECPGGRLGLLPTDSLGDNKATKK
jgi:hypothetical protein